MKTINFRIDLSKPFQIEGYLDPKRYKTALLILLSACDLCGLISLCFAGWFWFLIGVVIAVFLNIIFISIILNYTHKKNREYDELTEVVKKGILTYGHIKSLSVKKESSGDTVVYKVFLECLYADDSGNQKLLFVKTTSNSKPVFERGQFVMVAYYNGKSVMLKRYSLLTNNDLNEFEEIYKKALIDGSDYIGQLTVDGKLLNPESELTYIEFHRIIRFIGLIVLLGSPLLIGGGIAALVIYYKLNEDELFQILGFIGLVLGLTWIFFGAMIYAKQGQIDKKCKSFLNNKPLFTTAMRRQSWRIYNGVSKRITTYYFFDNMGNLRTYEHKGDLQDQFITVAYTHNEVIGVKEKKTINR